MQHQMKSVILLTETHDSKILNKLKINGIKEKGEECGAERSYTEGKQWRSIRGMCEGNEKAETVRFVTDG